MNQVSLLNQDLSFIPVAVRSNTALFNALGDTRDPECHTFHSVSVDIAWQVLSYAAGSALLIDAGLVGPLLPVQRSTFEAIANLRYLASHRERHFEATVYQAYTYLKDMEDFPDDEPLLQERRTILARMREVVVSTARQRAACRPWTWSGHSFNVVAEAGGLANVDRFWSYLSGRAHSGRVGLNVRYGAVRGKTQDVSIGAALSPEDADLHANFTRKCLHAAFRCIWGLVESPRIVFPTPDPAAFIPGRAS